MTAPVGYEQCLKFYGDPGPFIRDDGTPSVLWEAELTLVPFPTPLPLGWNLTQLAKGARVNRALESETARVFDLLAKEDLWRRLRTFDGGYAWRAQRGSTSKLSLHALGGALDFDAATNRLGRQGDMDRGIVQIFEACGWTWGGRFQRPDPMHYQFAKSV